MSHTGTPVASDMGMSNFMRTCLQVRMSRVSHEDTSCLTKKCVTSHIGMSHVWHSNEWLNGIPAGNVTYFYVSCNSFACEIWLLCTWHVSRRDKWVMSHTPGYISASFCSVLQCVAVCCSVLQCIAVCCSVLQCVALYCSMLQRVSFSLATLYCVVLCCIVLQCVAVCGIV